MLSKVERSEMELKATRSGALATECREHKFPGKPFVCPGAYPHASMQKILRKGINHFRFVGVGICL
jgi:hypothetical protein